MKKNDMAIILSAAIGTATLTVLFGAGTLEAGNEGDPLAAKVAKPKLVAEGVEMVLSAAKGWMFNGGQEPVFEFQAVNPTAKAATVDVRVAMASDSPQDPRSRVALAPSLLWQHEQTLALQPGETKVVTLATKTMLPTNRVISVSLQPVAPRPPTAAAATPAAGPAPRPGPFSRSGIVALSFSTAAPAAQPAMALARQSNGQAPTQLR